MSKMGKALIDAVKEAKVKGLVTLQISHSSIKTIRPPISTIKPNKKK